MRAIWFTQFILLISAPLGASQTSPQESAPTITRPSRTAEHGDAGVLGYYREPALHGSTIVFAAEGDLWTVSTDGGVARRLTSHLGEETNPVISPDGKTLAFSARYEGPTEVYTMPLTGGLPARRTFERESSTARAWTPDGRLVYETSRYSGLPRPGLVALDLESQARAPLPFDYCSCPDFDDTGATTYFVRPPWHRNVTKRYTGGTARDIWVYTEGDEEATRLTGDHDGESHAPMWWKGRLYFVSDRDGTMNVWSMESKGGDLRQHTRHSTFDVRTPSLDEGRIVYQRAADLWLLDIAGEATQKLPIRLASDLEQLRQKWVDEPMDSLTSAHLHPEGKSVVLTSRGRAFVAPAGQGRLVRASRKDGVRFRDVTFMPDGENLIGLSDESGELELTRIPASGVGDDEPLSSDGTILRFNPAPSPDGARIAFTDNNRDLFVFDVERGTSTRINESREGVGDLAWSPDGRWLAFTLTALNSFGQVMLHDCDGGVTVAVTSDRVHSFSPAWDAEGDFLYFLSERHLESLVSGPWGRRQPEPYFDRMVELYHVALRPGVRSPFRPDDELSSDAESEEENEPEEADATEKAEASVSAPPTEIVLAGLASRLERVPVAPGNYSALAVAEDALFLRTRGSGPSPRTDLAALEFENDDPKLKTILEDVRAIELSLDRKHLMVRKGSTIAVAPAAPAKITDLNEHALDLSRWRFPLDVREDWRQIFVDAWRLERDYFYDPGMHGVDWEAVRDRFLPLVERVTTRDELSHLIGCMMGELSALHMSVRGGDVRSGQDEIQVATLGARMVRSPELGGYRIEKIYRSDPDYPDERGPLSDPFLDVHEGDVIEAVNGTAVLEVADIGSLLRNEVGQQVLLRVKPGGDRASSRSKDLTSRDIIVVPSGNESALRYADWQYTRRLKVEADSESQVGYVHLRAMGGGNVTEWYRQFYPVFQRSGLIIDVRNNRGGNIDSFILSKLLRKDWMYWSSRTGKPYWNMQYAFRGHVVVLVNEMTASDGEAFADGFRRLGLGPVIGMRTWGGEIWLSSSNRLSDGGIARAPMYGVYGPEGKWLVEQIGVVPDMEVDNLPVATFKGGDAQLDAAIRYLQERIAEDPRPVPAPPEYPDRSFDYAEERR